MPAKILIVPAVITVAVAVHLYRDEEFREKVLDHYHKFRLHAATAIHNFADKLAPPQRFEEVPLTARASSPSRSSHSHRSPSPSEWSESPARRRRYVHDADVNAVGAVTSAYEPETERELFGDARSEASSETETGGMRTPTTSAETVEAVEPERGAEMAPEMFWSIHEWAENATGSPASSPSLAGSAAEELSENGWEAGSDEGSTGSAGEGSMSGWSEVGSDVSERRI